MIEFLIGERIESEGGSGVEAALMEEEDTQQVVVVAFVFICCRFIEFNNCLVEFVFNSFEILTEDVHGNRHESDVDDFTVVATDQLTVSTGGGVPENFIQNVGGEADDGTVSQVGACADSLEAFGAVWVRQDRGELSGVFNRKKSEHAGGIAVNVATADGGDGIVEADDVVDRLRGESLLHLSGATCVGEAEGSLEFSGD